MYGVAGTAGQLCAQPLPELTTIRDVRSLTPEQARQGRPVRLRGVVTGLSGWKSSFFFQDTTAGISVDRTNDSPELQAGQSVEVRGVTGSGLFAPIVIAESVTARGQGKLPAAHFLGLDKLAGGKQDSQWIAIRGIVRSAAVKPSWGRSVLFLEIDIGGGNLVTVRVHDFTKAGLGRLPSSSVSVRGVCGTVFNDKRQFVGLRLFVSNLGDLKVEKPAPADPFDIPIMTLGGLLRFDNQAGALSRIRVQGVVTYSQPGQGLYLQDGPQGVFIQSGQTTPVALGTRLDAVGFPAAGRYSPKLDDAVFRVIGAAQPPAALPETASGMIVEQDGFPSAPYDSVLVQLKGRLVEELPGADQELLFFRDGPSVFTARLFASEQNRRELAIGSLVRITGVCAANADEAHEARSFEILLRSCGPCRSRKRPVVDRNSCRVGGGTPHHRDPWDVSVAHRSEATITFARLDCDRSSHWTLQPPGISSPGRATVETGDAQEVIVLTPLFGRRPIQGDQRFSWAQGR